MDSEQFRFWRKSLGYTQAEAAEALGLKKPTITLYERGSRHGDGRPVVIPKSIEIACGAMWERRFLPARSAEEADRAAKWLDIVSPETVTRVKRVRIDGPIDVLSIKGPLDVMNRFKTFANAAGHMSYWAAIDDLLKHAGH
ncbi:helix-turn-helix domain-containing protein [Aureimonas psammosilenae]|uniref:helix-turn-helix domain-containing protein n=1 Tax=Aureimonas psammosilenae TaxID=2495496 RepID=UPI001260AF0D|nr:helix-turn-helix transcriptional regulator [Aureimonas psammosilenae]